MEPEWAAVELLDCIDIELNPGRGAEQQQQLSSQATLSAIRVLPAPVAGDLFVTCAARGNIGVIIFYYEEGEQSTILFWSMLPVFIHPVGSNNFCGHRAPR